MRDTRRARVVLGLFLATALVLLTVDYRGGNGSPLGPLRGIGAAIFGPIEKSVAAAVHPIGSTIATFTGATRAQQKIDRLEQENVRLRRQLAEGGEAQAQQREFARVMRLAGLGQYRVVSAQVIARRGAPGFEEAVEIDAGAADGIRPDMTVLNGDGLVGRVVHAGPVSSTVALLTDAGSAVGARLEASREIGVVHGLGKGEDGRVKFQLLDSSAPIQPGQRILSFGSERSAPYVPGVPVATVERVVETPGELTRVAYARPFASFTALDVVAVVVRAPARDPRDAVLPEAPR